MMRLRVLLSAIDFILECITNIMLVWTSHGLSTNNYWLAHFYFVEGEAGCQCVVLGLQSLLHALEKFWEK
jgi:hypothetical protein